MLAALTCWPVARQMLETVWLRNTDFVAGKDISIAGERCNCNPCLDGHQLCQCESCLHALRMATDNWCCRHADLLMCCELEQLVMLGAAAPDVPRQEALLAPFSKVRDWQERVKAATSPHYGVASDFLHVVAERMAAASTQSSM